MCELVLLATIISVIVDDFSGVGSDFSRVFAMRNACVCVGGHFDQCLCVCRCMGVRVMPYGCGVYVWFDCLM